MAKNLQTKSQADEQLKKEIFIYLNSLINYKELNTVIAPRLVKVNFGVTDKQAMKYVKEWLESHDEEKS